MLMLFHEIFGPNFINHVAFIFTKWSKAKRDVKLRQKNGDTEVLKRTSFVKKLVECGIIK